VNRTRVTSLIALAIAGAVVGYLGELAFVAAGGAAIVPPISLPVTLVGVGAVVVALAWPIRRAVKGTVKTRIDPFRAMRVAVLAKASSLVGALLTGAGAGILLFLGTRSVLPGLGSVWLAIATTAGAAILLAAGLLAEHFCTLPPGDDTEQHEEARV
jgi:hypothetical protein